MPEELDAETLRVAVVPALRAVPGLVHGFERRHGAAGGEPREAARRRVAAALQAHGRLFVMRQVHGASVRRAPWDEPPAADAALALAAGELVAVETADCLPILLVDPATRAVAAVHAGWRGTAAGVATAAVRALVECGARGQDLIAALGPANEACCYEVGEELRAAFGLDAEAVFKPGPRGRPHLDVRLANARQLVRAGVAPERIHHVAECTGCRPDLYHSYRREGPGGGRMLSYIGFAGPGGPVG